jgi:hypothetical protein
LRIKIDTRLVILGIAFGLFLFLFGGLFFAEGQISELKRHVYCLEHPSGASSIVVTLRSGGKVVQSKAHKTSCLHPK